MEFCTQLPVHPRHPYVGDLVFLRLLGFAPGRDQERLCGPAGGRTLGGALSSGRPADLGRSYESIIRVNSQSGKGGIAFLLETEYGMVLPRRLQVEFSAAVQRVTDVSGGEMSAGEIWQTFESEYLAAESPFAYVEHHLFEHGDQQGIISLTVRRGRVASL